jgi:hypothetical protein
MIFSKIRIQYKRSRQGIIEEQISAFNILKPHYFEATTIPDGQVKVYCTYQVVSAEIPENNYKIKNIECFINDQLLLRQTLESLSNTFGVTYKGGKHGAEAYSGQRGKGKRELYKRFVHPALQEYYKGKLFLLFQDRCYKCGSNGKLDIDHHIPMIRGGHLVPGNLVVLCKVCNTEKHNKLPNEFYSSDELIALDDYLSKEYEIFDFKFDFDKWNSDTYAYMKELEIPEELAREISDYRYDPNYWKDRVFKLKFWLRISKEELERGLKWADEIYPPVKYDEQQAEAKKGIVITIGIKGIYNQ